MGLLERFFGKSEEGKERISPITEESALCVDGVLHCPRCAVGPDKEEDDFGWVLVRVYHHRGKSREMECRNCGLNKEISDGVRIYE